VSFIWIKRSDGTSEFTDYANTLPEKDKAKLLATISRIEEHGLEVAKKAKWVKKLREGISEIRLRQGNDIQRALYFHKIGPHYVITHGFTKKSDEVPASEIEHSKKMRDEYLKGDAE
jgi:phage-related protein